MSQEYTPERTVTGVFQQENQVDQAIRRLIDRGVPQEYISVMGRNFQTQSRITGFISKKDVILGGLRTGAIFGSLFGSLLSLLTGVGVLFIPFVGSVVAAGPISSILLGAATGALAGSAGAGFISVLTAMGMPEDKAAIYETRLKAGEFVVMAEVPAAKSGEYQLLMESAGGEEIHLMESALPRPCPGRCNSAEDLSPAIRSHLSSEAQKTFVERYNEVFDETEDETKAEHAAWEKVSQEFDEDEDGVWSKQKVSV